MGMALRPAFEVELACRGREVLDRLCRHLETTPLGVRRTRVPGGGIARNPRDEGHVVVTMPLAEQHFWSPWLTIEVSARGESSHVLARFSPHPSVWTGFAFGYLALGLIFAVALTVVASGALLPGDGQLWALWVAGGATIAMIVMWSAAQVGQRLAHDQMQHLRRELERAIDVCH